MVRLALLYTIFYGLLLSALLIVLYWSSARYASSQIKVEIGQELTELTRNFSEGGISRLSDYINERKEHAIDDGWFYLLAKMNGLPVAGNLTKWPNEADVLLEGGVRSIWLDDGIMVGSFYRNDAYLPAVAREFPDGSRLLLARGVEQDNVLRELSENLKESLPAVVFFALLMGLTLGWSILRRMDTISMAANEIMAGDLTQRVPISDKNDEFDALAACLNNMLDKIEKVLTGIREVTDNVAHDLRSPVTRIRNRMEITLLEERENMDYREAMKQTIYDAEMMIRTFNAILHVAQADAGTIRAELVPVDLSNLVREMGEFYAPIAEEAGLDLHVHADDIAIIQGNRDLLAQAIVNLLDNAMKYTPGGGSICLRVERHSPVIDLIVEDTGPGIPESEFHRVRQRFVRLDTGRHSEGNGLGLTLVDAIARQHDGSLILEDNDPGLRAMLRFRDGVPDNPPFAYTCSS